jgi:uncharacterized protein
MISHRQVAYKVWIGDLLKSKMVVTTGEMEPNYFSLYDKQVSRVNVVAFVVNKNEMENGVSLDVDDGTGQISLRAWQDDLKILEGFGIGDLVLIMGRPREFSSTIYIVPEIVRKLDNYAWIKFRKLELEKLYGLPLAKEEKEVVSEETKEVVEEQVPIEEEVIEATPDLESTGKVISLIEKLDVGEGVDVKMMVDESDLSEAVVSSVVSELLKSGEVFEIKPGRMRVLP